MSPEGAPESAPSATRPDEAARALTVREILSRSVAFFSSKGVETARLDAERMIAEVLGTERLEIYLEPERLVSDEQRTRLRELVRRRAAREPAQYILGTAGFYGLDLAVDPRALVPRRETELLVDRAREIAGTRSVRVLELGTGCGCIALALAKNLAPGTSVVATDRSLPALALARENAAALGLEDSVTFAQGDLFAALAPGTHFDMIVANLPYVCSDDIGRLPPEVHDHEPREALDGGADGLEVVRACIKDAPRYLAPGGWMLLEVGLGQAAEACALLAQAGLEPGPVLKDAAHYERLVQGRMPADAGADT
jgi:release factor glutamine methyltransferase